MMKVLKYLILGFTLMHLLKFTRSIFWNIFPNIWASFQNLYLYALNTMKKRYGCQRVFSFHLCISGTVDFLLQLKKIVLLSSSCFAQPQLFYHITALYPCYALSSWIGKKAFQPVLGFLLALLFQSKDSHSFIYSITFFSYLALLAHHAHAWEFSLSDIVSLVCNTMVEDFSCRHFFPLSRTEKKNRWDLWMCDYNDWDRLWKIWRPFDQT